MTSVYDQYFPIRKMFFKTYVGNTLKYCISWLNWDPKDLAMVTADALVNYSTTDLNNVKLWRDYKKEINYKSTFETYARERKINLTCTYDLSFEKIGMVSGIPLVCSANGAQSATKSTPLSILKTNKRKYSGEEPEAKRVKWMSLNGLIATSSLAAKGKRVHLNLEEIVDVPELISVSGDKKDTFKNESFKESRIESVIPRQNNAFIRVVNMVVMVLAFILHFVLLYINFAR